MADTKNLFIINKADSSNYTQLGLINESVGDNFLKCYRQTSSTAYEEYNILHTGNYSSYAPMIGIVGDDFNSLTKSGMYRFNTSSNHANIPPLSWGQCLVVHGAGDTIA
jgi:hypothetical protein